jgi:hypothetical protein
MTERATVVISSSQSGREILLAPASETSADNLNAVLGNYLHELDGINLLACKNSMTKSSKAAGSSMLQACPVFGSTLWTAPGINDAVRCPAFKELSY